ncbi:uncharacterized protein LOC124286670 [Haliotis rubra]|uniref:uncharacterized protein LOC124286670 n=1 Tax=Haliotis rubra TaxID=36100 RepID=UPI001EE549EE|nr:uncharacterized protein LOC124286670 [Haliotis rubra]
MPVVGCPIPSCGFVTEDLDFVVHATVHTTGPAISAKVEKVKRPSISSAGTSEDWSYFKSRWKDYVQTTMVTGKDRVVQLHECCYETLRRDFTRSAVLKAIRLLAVREENTMVARVTLHSMTQDRDETVRSFGARLRGQAGVCKFTIACPGCHREVNYTETILRDVLTLGLIDPEIQLDLLGDKNQDTNLEQVFQFVEAKESGTRSASRLLDSQSVEAVSSGYRRSKNTAVNASKKLDTSESYFYCGRKGHGKSASLKIRKKHCPAFGRMCSSCTRYNHFETES